MLFAAAAADALHFIFIYFRSSVYGCVLCFSRLLKDSELSAWLEENCDWTICVCVCFEQVEFRCYSWFCFKFSKGSFCFRCALCTLFDFVMQSSRDRLFEHLKCRVRNKNDLWVSSGQEQDGSKRSQFIDRILKVDGVARCWCVQLCVKLIMDLPGRWTLQ